MRLHVEPAGWSLASRAPVHYNILQYFSMQFASIAKSHTAVCSDIPFDVFRLDAALCEVQGTVRQPVLPEHLHEGHPLGVLGLQQAASCQ